MTPLRAAVAEALATAFLSGRWNACAMAKRARLALGRLERWPFFVARRVLARFPAPPRDAFTELATFLANDKHVIRGGTRLRFGEVEVAMAPRAEWKLPRIDTVGELARWLSLSLPDLAWLADLSGFARRRRDPRLVHYVSRWLPKRTGGARLVEAPKRSLKEAQRRILAEILGRIPPHEAAHGFRRGRSPLTHASAHAGKRVVLRIDLEEFFASIPVARVIAVFRSAGYTRTVARVLACLCTTYSAVEPSPLNDWRSRRRYAARHLPQGAPTSPALANLCAYRLDVRLSHLGVTYTRYADDLVFSSHARLDRLAPLVAAIAQSEGFCVNHRKTRLMRAAVRQEVTGLVVNARPNVSRRERERLEAILFNCVRHGPASQNRDGQPDFRAHLTGKLAWLRSVNEAQAASLDALFGRIDWASDVF